MYTGNNNSNKVIVESPKKRKYDYWLYFIERKEYNPFTGTTEDVLRYVGFRCYPSEYNGTVNKMKSFVDNIKNRYTHIDSNGRIIYDGYTNKQNEWRTICFPKGTDITDINVQFIEFVYHKPSDVIRELNNTINKNYNSLRIEGWNDCFYCIDDFPSDDINLFT